MKTLKRSVLLAALSLSIGIPINQFLNEGIPWRLLLPSKTDRNIRSRITLIAADTTFFKTGGRPAFLIDIRSRADFRVDHLSGAQNMPFTDFFRKPSRFSLPEKATYVVLYDFEPNSKKARIFSQWLAQHGFMRVNMLYPGMAGWIEAGLPVDRGGGP